jgi:hypothetical protein
MTCDTKLKPKQTAKQRADEIRAAVSALAAGLSSGAIKAKIGPQGAIAFDGWREGVRDGVTDACAYRYLMATGSAFAKQAIAKAETLAGRRVSTQAIGAGVHSHDGGVSWSTH